MAIPRDFLQSIYEDADSFGEDTLYQNEMLANIINPPMPVVQPAPQLIAPVAPVSDPVEQLFASQPAAPASPTVAPTTPAPVAKPAGPSQDIINALSQQILGSSDTSRWSGQGFGSAQANAADMAKILANAGITDVRQLGVKQVVVPAQYYESGETPEHTVNSYYNKETGQDLGNLGGTYAERQTGNFFGGTFEGKGNTGYGVQFRPDGTPVFYTQGASSNDVAKIMEMAGPVGQIAAAALGGPAAVAAIAVASGKDPIDIIKSTALAYLGNAAGSAVSGMEGITDVLGKTGTDIVSNATKQYVGSGGKADIGEALLGGAVNTGLNFATSSIAPELGLDKLSPVEQKILNAGITGLIKGQPLEQTLTNAVIAGVTTKPDDKLKSGFGPGDMDEFRDSLIPGYFQPGGAGYIEPAPEPAPEPTPAPEEMTVQQEPTNIEEFIKSLEPYVAPEPTPAPLPEPTPAEERIIPAERPSSITEESVTPEELPFDLESILQPLPELEPEPVPVPAAEDVPELVMTAKREEPTVTEEPADLSSLLRDLWPYAEPEKSVFAQTEDIPEMETVDKRPIPEISSTVDLMDLLQLPPLEENIPELVMTGERPMPSPDEDFMPTYPEENIPELVMTGERPSTPSPEFESVFDPTFGGELPLPELPTTPTTPVKPITPVKTTPVKTAPAPTTPAASSSMNLASLLALLSAGQQPAQQAPMQDPYAHIKLMEDLFGSEIDLTPAGEDTAKRK